MAALTHLLVFAIDAQRFALPIGVVERVLAAVYITALPKAPPLVLGVINMRGRIIPVINLRHYFHAAERDIQPDDQIIIAHCMQGVLAMVVDSTEVVACPEKELVPLGQMFPMLGEPQNVFKRPDGIVPLCSLDSVLSLEELLALREALGTSEQREGTA